MCAVCVFSVCAAFSRAAVSEVIICASGSVVLTDGTIDVYKRQEWKLWAPTVMEVSLELFSCGSSRERGDRKIASIAMTRGEKGVWSCAMQGAWYGTYYTYHILHSDGVFDTTDPYGVASGIDSERSMVVNLAETDPAGWEQEDVYKRQES